MRRTYAAQPSDLMTDAAGNVQASETFEVYLDDLVTPVTDLRILVAGVWTASTVLESSGIGRIKFQGPDEEVPPFSLWIKEGTEFYMVLSIDVAAELVALKAQGVALTAGVASVPGTLAVETAARVAAFAAHNEDDTAHPNKVTVMNGTKREWVVGNVPGVGNVPMPTAAGGLQVGDFIDVVG